MVYSEETGHHHIGVAWHEQDVVLCLLGGIALGSIAASRMAIFGKVTGISGFIQNTFVVDKKYVDEHGLFDHRRISSSLFLIGVMFAGVICRQYLPECFQDWSVIPIERLIIAGILVGFGTKKGNGCTSGHGVCGISSFRIRSLVATISFMLTAFITAMSTNTYSYLPTFHNEVSIGLGYAIALIIIATCSLLSLFAYGINRTTTSSATATGTPAIHPTLSLFYSYLITQELVFGILFGLCMGLSNMTLLSAVIAFLDLRYWNPALAFVMGGAIAIATPSFYALFHHQQTKRSTPWLDHKFHLPTLNQIDRSLVIGSAIFGIGWGLVGACPGPALVNVGSGNIPPIIYAFAIVVGMYIEHWSNSAVEYCTASVKSSATTTGSTVETKKYLTEEDIETDSNRTDG